MGKRGPRPEPTILKVVKGNPGKRPLNASEPAPARDRIEPPSWLSDASLAKWHEVVPKLMAMRVMTNADVDAIARYCVMHELYAKYLSQVRRGLDVLVIRDEAGRVKYMQATPAATQLNKLEASMLRIEQEFGMTPSSRSGVNAASEVKDDSLAAFAARRRG
jgi:P27 family predicted phage terminase small subunit